MEKLNAVWGFSQAYSRFHKSLCLVIIKPQNTPPLKARQSVSQPFKVPHNHLWGQNSCSHRGKQGLQGAGIRPGQQLLSPEYLGRWQTLALAAASQEGSSFPRSAYALSYLGRVLHGEVVLLLPVSMTLVEEWKKFILSCPAEELWASPDLPLSSCLFPVVTA